MEHEYTDQPVTAWGGMKEMRELLDKTGISEKLSTLPLPISTLWMLTVALLPVMVSKKALSEVITPRSPAGIATIHYLRL